MPKSLPPTKAIVLTGGDKVFAAGADINDFLTISTADMYLRHSERYWEAITNCRKPIIAAVNGYALGGGCELAMHADIIIAGKSAKFGQPEIKIGLMPGAGGTQRLFRAIGKHKAMKMVLTGDMISADEADTMGLVSEVVDDEATITRAIEIAEQLSTYSPIALAQIKEVANLGVDMSLEGALALERKAFQILSDTHLARHILANDLSQPLDDPMPRYLSMLYRHNLVLAQSRREGARPNAHLAHQSPRYQPH